MRIIKGSRTLKYRILYLDNIDNITIDFIDILNIQKLTIPRFSAYMEDCHYLNSTSFRLQLEYFLNENKFNNLKNIHHILIDVNGDEFDVDIFEELKIKTNKYNKIYICYYISGNIDKDLFFFNKLSSVFNENLNNGGVYFSFKTYHNCNINFKYVDHLTPHQQIYVDGKKTNRIELSKDFSFKLQAFSNNCICNIPQYFLYVKNNNIYTCPNSVVGIPMRDFNVEKTNKVFCNNVCSYYLLEYGSKKLCK